MKKILTWTGMTLGAALDLMKLVAEKRFVHLKQDEVDALHAYLRTLAAESS